MAIMLPFNVYPKLTSTSYLLGNALGSFSRILLGILLYGASGQNLNSLLSFPSVAYPGAITVHWYTKDGVKEKSERIWEKLIHMHPLKARWASGNVHISVSTEKPTYSVLPWNGIPLLPWRTCPPTSLYSEVNLAFLLDCFVVVVEGSVLICLLVGW